MADEDFFSKMMFGGHSESQEDQSDKDAEKESESETEADYTHIMNQLGEIMDSIDKLTPTFKEIGSMVGSLKDKLFK
ncbi:hypothetical protein PJ311_05575 [Bacillus sp. CLL-7-23]|uniref:Spore coat protein n=1 Tax=Bacillus changyiensis TaxID=3004103 RepID=A0ABT4X2X6_9BACI|nr:hypothetical protein [Bacillus changyiensis]MDA7026084.1 hypothetical protein [Bacillus changyiensis]